MSTLAFVPARGGSKSIPAKNIRPFHGSPLISWILRALQSTPTVDRIVLASDCKEIHNCAQQLRLNKVEHFQRSVKSAEDTASTEYVMLEYLNSSAGLQLESSDTFLLAQATSPLTTADDFAAAIAMQKSEQFDSVLSAVRFQRFLWTKNGEAINYDPNQRPRRQDFAGCMMENGALYVSSIAAIRESKNRISGRIGIYAMDDSTAIELDEEQDWLNAESLLNAQEIPASSPRLQSSLD